MKKFGWIAVVAMGSASVISIPNANAAPKAGGACKANEVGTTATAGSASLECKKSGKAGKWVRVTVTTTAPPTTAPPTTAPPAPSTAAPAVAIVNGQGVTDTTIKVGFIDAAFRTPAGFLPSSTGNATAQINAVVEAINAQGGIGGRKVTAVIKQMDLGSSNDGQAASLCAAFGDDEKVFAVVSQSILVSASGRECFAKKKILWLEAAGSFPLDTATLERMSPYAFMVNLPAIDRIGRSYAKMLVDEKFFGDAPKDTKWGILAMGDSPYKNAVEDLKAELKKAGIEPADTVFFDTTSQDTVSRDSSAAAPRFAAKGITHVVSLVSAGNTAQFMWAAEDNKYFPRMSFTSYDNIKVLQNATAFRLPRAVSKANLANALAIGFYPIADAEDTQLTFPQAGPEQRCIDIYSKKQLITGFESRYLSRYAQAYCDGMYFLKTVGDKSKGGLNAEAFTAEAEKLGSKGFDASIGWLTKFGPKRHDGGDGYRVLKFNPLCSKPFNGCLEYASGVKPFI